MANVETMFCVGETPFHGLGVSVTEALTSKEALVAAGLDWTVESKKIQVCGGKSISGYKANVRSSDNSVLGLVTDKYKIVQNAEAFSFTDNLLGEGVRYETAGSLANGQRVWMLAKMDTAKICGDIVEPYLVFTNSHDGKGCVKAALVPIRVVCQNTLTLALSKASRTWSFRHMGNIQANIEAAQETLFNANKYMQNLEETSEKATEIVVVNPQFLDFVEKMFPINKDDSNRKIANVEDMRQNLKNIYFNKEDIQKFRGTAYGVIQAVADFHGHYQPARMTDTFAENRFMKLADGSKEGLMERACAYFNV